MHQGLMVLIYDHLKANQIAHMQPSVDSEDEGSDPTFSKDEESESDPTTDTKDNMDVSNYESGKKRKHIKTRPSSSKGKKPKGKPLISISMEEETLDDFEEEYPQGWLKKKTKAHTEARKMHKKKEETVKEPEVQKQVRALDDDQNLEKETMEEALRAVDTTIQHTPKEKMATPEKSLNILKISANNTNTLINKLDDYKEILDIDPETKGTGEAQGPRTRTEGKKKDKKPNKDLEDLKAIGATYDELVMKAKDLLKKISV
ncbi:uncharacterized protein LOC131858011 [Cryptomeria japonica]|uniref:uncharacterized protein LOC131858011 n=1 Tax=Cryptomeria japonica TaxID=3369 RepID=UPI0027DA9C0E|nr:uncharacterized protein LOC131858011 [Cryptomeria japonica]